jgi:dTDP-4-dehydrorhamnose 3,5-epimerase
MLQGIKIFDLKKQFDERGFFAELIRNDWRDFFESDLPVQISLSVSYPGMIRAWHHHTKQVDYLLVIKGAMKIVAYDDDSLSPTRGQMVEQVVNEEKLQIVRVPGHYWHGTKTLGIEPSITVYAVSRLYDYDNPDEGRRPWNDQTIIDPRTKQPYDWNKPPHK